MGDWALVVIAVGVGLAILLAEWYIELRRR